MSESHAIMLNGCGQSEVFNNIVFQFAVRWTAAGRARVGHSLLHSPDNRVYVHIIHSHGRDKLENFANDGYSMRLPLRIDFLPSSLCCQVSHFNVLVTYSTRQPPLHSHLHQSNIFTISARCQAGGGGGGPGGGVLMGDPHNRRPPHPPPP